MATQSSLVSNSGRQLDAEAYRPPDGRTVPELKNVMYAGFQQSGTLEFSQSVRPRQFPRASAESGGSIEPVSGGRFVYRH